MDAGKLEAALAAFEASNNLLPHFKTLEKQGECLIRLGRLSDAVGPLSKSVEMNAGVRAPSMLAELYFELEKYDEAAELAEIALSRDPNNRKALKVRSDLRTTE